MFHEGLLNQPGVTATGGGTGYDPAKDIWEFRYDNDGNQYNSRVGIPMFPGHSKDPDKVISISQLLENREDERHLEVLRKYRLKEIEEKRQLQFAPADFNADEFSQRVAGVPTPSWLGEAPGAMSSATRESIFSDTDQFGNPLSTDSFGQTSYDINAQRQGILDEVMMQKWDKEDAPVKPATKKADVRSNYPSHFTPWLIEQLEGQRKRDEFFQSAKDTISDTAGDLYQGAQTLGSDIYDKGTGAAKTLMDLFTPEEDNRTHRQQMIDNQTNIVEPVKKFITDLPELAGDIYKGTVAPFVTGPDSLLGRFSGDSMKERDPRYGVANTAGTSLGNVPGQLGEVSTGLTELATNPEARRGLYDSMSDLTLGTMEKLNDGPLFDTELGKEQAPKRIKTANDAIAGVKDVLTNWDKFQDYASQNPLDLLGAGWLTKIGAQKLGKTLGPKAGDKIEQHLTDIGAIKQMAPPKRINRGSMPEAEFEAMKAQVRENWAVGKTKDAAENRRRGSQASMEIRERVKRYDLEAKKIDEGLLGQTPKKPRKTAWHNSDAKFDAVDPKKWEAGPLGEGHYMITNPNAKNFYEGKYQYESLLPENIDEVTVVTGWNSKQSDLVQKAFISIQKDLPNVDLALKKGGQKTKKFDSSSRNAEYAYSVLLDELGIEKGYALLKKHGIRGMRNDGKTPSYAIFDMDKIEMKRIKQLNKKPPKFKQGILDFD